MNQKINVMNKTNKNILIGSSIIGVAGLVLINQCCKSDDMWHDKKLFGMGMVGLATIMTASVALQKAKG